VVTHSTTIQAGSISSQAGGKYLMSKNVCILSDKGVFIHATLPSHKKFVQCSFDQYAMITGKRVIVPGPSLCFNSTKSIHKTRYVVLRVATSVIWQKSTSVSNKPSVSFTLQSKAVVNIHLPRRHHRSEDRRHQKISFMAN